MKASGRGETISQHSFVFLARASASCAKKMTTTANSGAILDAACLMLRKADARGMSPMTSKVGRLSDWFARLLLH